jgi:LysM repeat protein
MKEYDIIHRVAYGETAASVSAVYKVPASLILYENGLKGELYEGQRIVIPRARGKFYKVKPGDTIEDIARSFRVPSAKILADNRIDMIFPFMDIVISP